MPLVGGIYIYEGNRPWWSRGNVLTLRSKFASLNLAEVDSFSQGVKSRARVLREVLQLHKGGEGSHRLVGSDKKKSKKEKNVFMFQGHLFMPCPEFFFFFRGSPCTLLTTGKGRSSNWSVIPYVVQSHFLQYRILACKSVVTVAIKRENAYN